MRRARDSCTEMASSSWASCQSTDALRRFMSFSTDSARPAKRQTARERLLRMKEEAAHIGKSTLPVKDQDVVPGDETHKEGFTRPSFETHNSTSAEDSVDGGHSSSSDVESSECTSSLIRQTRCRFGITTLGTVPSTPAGEKKPCASPPGLSRKAAMREARDAYKARILQENQDTDVAAAHEQSVDVEDSVGAKSNSSSVGATADASNDAVLRESTRCRFGSTTMGTTPSTPVGGPILCASPPGLSRKAVMRQERDACKAVVSRSSTDVALTISPLRNYLGIVSKKSSQENDGVQDVPMPR